MIKETGCAGRLYDVETVPHLVDYTDTRGRSIALHGQLWMPRGEGRFPAVILCHGFNGHGTDFPAECTAWAARGYICCAFDFCGAQSGGKSRGRTAETYSPLTMKEDLRAVVESVAALERVDARQLFLFGGSQGGLVASLTAADEDMRGRIAGLAMYFPALSIPENWRGAPRRLTPLMGYWVGPEYIRAVEELDPYALIPGFPGDVCIVCGDRDPLVTGKTVERAVRAYGEDRVDLTVIPGAGHGFGGPHLELAVNQVLAFLDAHTVRKT